MDLDKALATRDLSIDKIMKTARAVILFGSRGAGLHKPDSDWDLLIAGEGRNRISRHLDLVYIKPSSFDPARNSWPQSELATHCARWGVTIAGDEQYLKGLMGQYPSKNAAAKKLAKIKRNFVSYRRRQKLKLSGWQIKDYAIKLRRDLQRYDALRMRIPVAPNALLDAEVLSPQGLEHLLKCANLRNDYMLETVGIDLHRLSLRLFHECRL